MYLLSARSSFDPKDKKERNAISAFNIKLDKRNKILICEAPNGSH